MLLFIATGLLFIVASSGLGYCEEYYVSSTTLECTGNLQPCHSLLFYFNDSQQYFVDDAIFYFMEGTHILDGHELLAIRDVNNLTLKGLDYKLEDGFHETMKICKKIKSQIMRMPQTARKISQRRKHLRSLRVPFVDDKHVVAHDMENMVTVELYDEDGDFVTRRRETLIREDLID
uniref:Uncharacterized protein n=1 Tax=Amphimedon queenslandica TaxID=400682 RepID=A0A1X7ULG4_AMPQE